MKNTVQEKLSSPEAVTMVREWLKENQRKGGKKGRKALADYLCEALDLRDPRGNPQIAGVLKALRVLESRGYWKLPGTRFAGRSRCWEARRLPQAVPVPQGVAGRVEEVQGLYLVEVTSKDDELFRTWNELMLSEHPLQDGRLVGRQLRYLIGCEQGWLGAIGFGSCALRLGPRDEWIGWDKERRREYQDRLINMSRFLIRPQVRCENLASRVLSLCLSRVGPDFERRYGVEPWLVETFVNSEQYAGVCYQASNWEWVGQSKGRGHHAPNDQQTSRKQIYVYELRSDWRRCMRLPTPGETIEPIDIEAALGKDWVDQEFGPVDLGHEKRRERLLEIVRRKAQNPSAPYTECCDGNRHQLKAYYRFIGNEAEEMSVESILSGHRQRTVGRMKGLKRALVVQDTSALDFSQRLHCNGLGTTGTNQTGATSAGLDLHSALAFSETGLPLGVLGMQIYAPEVGQAKDPDRPIEEKESYRWLQNFQAVETISRELPRTELICIADRESDIFELFDYRRRRARQVHLLIRAKHDRCLLGESESSKKKQKKKLFRHLAGLPVRGKVKLQIPRQREKKSKPSKAGQIALPARTAQVELRWDRVCVAAPQTKQTRDLAPIELYAISVSEPHPPVGAKAIHWVLLTTVPVPSRKQALRCLRWYTRRWRIEEWHRVLKSGCRIEAHQHQDAARLAKAIAIDGVIAWRVMLLTLLGREVPEMPCELVFSDWECRLLQILQPLVAPETTDQKKTPSRSAPPVRSLPDWAAP